MRSVCAQYPDYFGMLEIGYRDGFHFHLFYKYFAEPDTYYVKLDDDVCWMDDGAVETLVRYKMENPHMLVALSNTVNNGICSHLHQRMGLFNSNVTVDYNGHFVSYMTEPDKMNYVMDIHEGFLAALKNGTWERYKSAYQWILNEYAIRVSINCICMLGKDVGDHLELILKTANDEETLSETLPGKIGRFNGICGKSLISHFAFNKQREYLETNTDLLDKYRALAGLKPWRQS
jgi:hypothetical protein